MFPAELHHFHDEFAVLFSFSGETFDFTPSERLLRLRTDQFVVLKHDKGLTRFTQEVPETLLSVRNLRAR